MQAIGDAVRLLRNDEADIALCGGTEAAIDTVSLRLRRCTRHVYRTGRIGATGLSAFRQRPGRICHGEGAGMLVIETLEHALARGATPLAEIVGYGTSADAYHMTSGAEDGNGAYRAMKIALKQANVAPEEVQHLNAHATSTPVGDLGEINAIKHLFGTAGTVAVTSTKSATGHLLGAAGGLETIFTALALRDQIAPATLNHG